MADISNEDLKRLSDTIERSESTSKIDKLKSLTPKDFDKDVIISAISDGFGIQSKIESIASKDPLLSGLFKTAKLIPSIISNTENSSKETNEVLKTENSSLEVLKEIQKNTSPENERLKSDLQNTNTTNTNTTNNTPTSEENEVNKSINITNKTTSSILSSGLLGISKLSSIAKFGAKFAGPLALGLSTFKIDSEKFTDSINSLQSGNFVDAINNFQDSFSASDALVEAGKDSASGDFVESGLGVVKSFIGETLSDITGINRLFQFNIDRKNEEASTDLKERLQENISIQLENPELSKEEKNKLKLERELLEELIQRIKDDNSGQIGTSVFLLGAKNISVQELKSISETGEIKNNNLEVQELKGRSQALFEDVEKTNSEKSFRELERITKQIKILEGSDESAKSIVRSEISNSESKKTESSDFITKNETGKTGIDAFSVVSKEGNGDAGGKSFGRFQFSSNRGVVQDFVEQSEFKNEFSGLDVKGQAFEDKFKELAETSESFRNEQIQFAEKQYFEPARKASEEFGLDFQHLSNETKEVIKGTSVQFGNGGLKKKLRQVTELSGQDDLSNISDEKFIKLLTQAKTENVSNDFRSSSVEVQNSVKNRFQREETEVLSSLKTNNVERTEPILLKESIKLAKVESESFSKNKENLQPSQQSAEIQSSPELPDSGSLKTSNSSSSVLEKLSQRNIFNQLI